MPVICGLQPISTTWYKTLQTKIKFTVAYFPLGEKLSAHVKTCNLAREKRKRNFVEHLLMYILWATGGFIDRLSVLFDRFYFILYNSRSQSSIEMWWIDAWQQSSIFNTSLREQTRIFHFYTFRIWYIAILW